MRLVGRGEFRRPRRGWGRGAGGVLAELAALVALVVFVALVGRGFRG